MFYLPLSLSFLFSYSSTILSFSFLKFFIPSFEILLCSFSFHHLVYSIYFSIHQKKSTSYRPYIDPTLNFFFCNTTSWKVKKNPPHLYCFSITTTFYCFPSTTTTFLLFLSNTTTTVLLFLSSTTTTTTTTTFLLFSLLLLFCYLSLVFLVWGWLVWPVAGLWPSKGQ